LLASVVAVSIAEPPAQIVAEFTLAVGSGLTVTRPLALLAQLAAPSLTVTV